MLNNVIIHGRLTKDVQLKKTSSGADVVAFSIANDRFVSGEKKTDFFDVIAWNANAKFVNQYFKKGDGIIIIGRLQTRDFTDKDGNARRTVEIVVDRVEFAGGGNKTEKNEPVNSGDLPFEV